MRKLYLDDSRQRPDFTWDCVRSYDAFVTYIETYGVPDLISFDHDLGVEHYEFYTESILNDVTDIPYNTFKEKTGYDCAKWLIDRGTLPKEYRVHSMNPVGVANIKFIMEAAYKHMAP